MRRAGIAIPRLPIPAAALALAALLGGCATVPDLDREMIVSGRTPVKMQTASGAPVSRQQTAAILQSLQQRGQQSDIVQRHLAVEQALADSPLSVGNRVTLLEDGAATYPAMLAAIRGARHHVHMEMYIFEGDEIGGEFARALMERARAGLKVRLVVDGVGSMGTPEAFFQQIAGAGVEVYLYNPVAAATVLAKGPGALNHRDHRKLLIVDGKVAFTGGINVSGVYTPQGLRGVKGGISGSRSDEGEFQDQPWRDTQVKIEGPVVADLQRGFFRIWGRMEDKPPIEEATYFPKVAASGPHIVRAVDGWTDSGVSPLYVTLISAIESAETEVSITMAYFVPHADLLDALKAAAKRGVNVRLVLPARTDHWLVFHAGRVYYDELLEAGVKIYERQARLLHAKTATVDRVWSTVGSTNLDWRSLTANEELNVVVLGAEFAAQMAAAFERDVARSEAITREAWAQRPIADRARETAAKMVAPIL